MATINYSDDRFTNVTNDKNTAINQSNSTYDNLMNQSSQYYDNLINQSKDYADKQTEIQNQQTQLAVDKIEQNKQEANKDYTKEQQGTYQDYMKQSNAYGSNMQSAGQQGLAGSGWSETIQSGFYNTMQNRYAQARDTYNKVISDYNTNITEAQLQNSSALLEIYNNAQQQQLEYALQQFTTLKDLSLNKLSNQQALDSEYNDRWQAVESQINTENSLAEQQRQFDEQIALTKQKYEQEMAQWEKEYALSQANLQLSRDRFNYEKSQASSSSATINKTSSGSATISGSNSSGSSTINSESTSSTSSSGTVKLSNGQTGYSSAIEAYQASGGKQPLSESKLISQGTVSKTTYNGKTYYYLTPLNGSGNGGSSW